MYETARKIAPGCEALFEAWKEKYIPKKCLGCEHAYFGLVCDEFLLNNDVKDPWGLAYIQDDAWLDCGCQAPDEPYIFDFGDIDDLDECEPEKGEMTIFIPRWIQKKELARMKEPKPTGKPNPHAGASRPWRTNLKKESRSATTGP